MRVARLTRLSVHVPVPIKVIVSGLKSLVTLSEEFRAPLADGVKLAVMVQELPGASTLLQLSVSLKSVGSAVTVTPTTITALDPVLVTVMFLLVLERNG